MSEKISLDSSDAIILILQFQHQYAKIFFYTKYIFIFL